MQKRSCAKTSFLQGNATPRNATQCKAFGSSLSNKIFTHQQIANFDL